METWKQRENPIGYFGNAFYCSGLLDGMHFFGYLLYFDLFFVLKSAAWMKKYTVPPAIYVLIYNFTPTPRMFPSDQ